MGGFRAGGLTGLMNQPSAQVIDGTLKFNGSNHYLNRTPGSGDRRTWTLSFWIKRGIHGTSQHIIGNYYNSANDGFNIRFAADDTLGLFDLSGGSYTNGFNVATTQVFRDTGWYHIVVALDTAQSTSTDRLKVYVNGTRVTSFSTTDFPDQNNEYNFNTANSLSIGRGGSFDGQYFGGYLSNYYCVDGQALTPDSFGFTDPLTNTWRPKKYEGTFGTNGFYLPMDGNSPIGQDKSGKGNNFTPQNFSGTSVDPDVLKDSPSGAVSGRSPTSGITTTNFPPSNYATLNPLDVDGSNGTFVMADGNLEMNTFATNYSVAASTITFDPSDPNGFYFESTGTNSAQYAGVGVAEAGTISGITGSPGRDGNLKQMLIRSDGYWYYNSSGAVTSGKTTWTSSDVIGCAFKNNKIWVSKNGVYIESGNPVTEANPNLTWDPANHTNDKVNFIVSAYTSNPTVTVNFGQKPFKYAPPDGFRALNLANIRPETVITRPDQIVGVTTYNAAGGNQIITLGFKPDLIISKSRDFSYAWDWEDIVRGGGFKLRSNSGDAAGDYCSNAAIREWRRDGVRCSSNMNATYDGGGVGGSVSYGFVAGNTAIPECGAICFDGTGDYLTFASTSAFLEDAGYTIDGWIYLLTAPANSNGEIIFDTGSGGNDPELNVYADGSGNIQLYDSLSNNTNWNGGAPYMNVGQWYYFKQTVDGSSASDASATHKLYIDGQLGVTNTINLSGRSASSAASIAARTDGSVIGHFILSNLRYRDTVDNSTDVPTAPFTGSEANTVLLCCNQPAPADDNADPTDSTTTPSTITKQGNPGNANITIFGRFTKDGVAHPSVSAAGLSGGNLTITGASVGTKNGFSIIRYNGNNSTGQTVKHGLTQKPDFMLVKNISQAYDWMIYHKSMGATYYGLFGPNAFLNNADIWADTEPTDSQFYVSVHNSPAGYSNGPNGQFISYIWHDVPGLQKFGSYPGNSSIDGVYIELGFRPSIIMIKASNHTSDWAIIDAGRGAGNPAGSIVRPNLNNHEDASSNYYVDILSNGFKLRTSTHPFNAGYNYVYCAWAEAPIVNLYGGQSNAR